MEGLTSQRISRFVLLLGRYLSTDILCSHTIRPHRLPPTRAGQNAIMTSDCRSYSPLGPNTIPPTNTRKDSKDLKLQGICTRDISYYCICKVRDYGVPTCKSRKGYAKFAFGLDFVGNYTTLEVYASFLQPNLQRDTVFRYPTQKEKF
jgi:hypothetical protein